MTDTPASGPIRACTISRDIAAFDELADEMQALLPGAWSDVALGNASDFLARAESAGLDFVTVALDADDGDDLPQFGEVVRAAAARNLKVIVVARDVGPVALHQLLSQGASGFVPYPLPTDALANALARTTVPPPAEARREAATNSHRDGVVLPVQGLAGGTGATTFAVNLAWELATIGKLDSPRVCLIDLDLQFGSAATYLDLPRREAVFELLTRTESMDRDGFLQALMPFHDRLSVLTAPADLLPLDLIGPEDVARVIEMARASFDYVVVDMPKTLVSWSETVLNAAHVYFALVELDMRSAQNTLRTIRALKSEGLPHEKLRHVLNRAPGFTDFGGRSRIRRMAESLGIKLEVQLPNGGRAVAESCDGGQPLGIAARKNPLRREIAKLAAQIHALNAATAAAALLGDDADVRTLQEDRRQSRARPASAGAGDRAQAAAGCAGTARPHRQGPQAQGAALRTNGRVAQAPARQPEPRRARHRDRAGPARRDRRDQRRGAGRAGRGC